MRASSGPALDLSHRRELTWLAQLLADLQQAAPAAEPLLVGALARDVLLHYGHGIAIDRGTADVDFAIALSDWPEFSAMRAALLASGSFESQGEPIHLIRHKRFGRIDLIPFGAIERNDGSIAWPPAGDEVMGVLAYAEANAAATNVALPLSQRVRVVSLPMLAVLKVLAWQDRHLHRPGADAADLWLILRKYLDAGNADRLYAEHTHLLTENFDFEPTGAWLLGRDARDHLQRHSERFDYLMRTLTEVLQPELDLAGKLTLSSQFSVTDLETAHRLLVAFHRGLLGAESP